MDVPTEHVLSALRARKMTRSFTGASPSEEAMASLTYAAMRGPSAGNTASVEVLILSGGEVDEYWDLTLPEERRANFPWPGLLKAPVLMIPTVDPDDYVKRYSEADKARTGLGADTDAWPVPYWWVDGGAAVENVLLMAAALNVGACFFGQFEHEPAVSAHFAIPDGRRAVGTIALGNAEERSDRPSKSAQRPVRSVEERTHYGRW